MSNKRWGCPWHGLVEDGGLQTPAGRLYIGYPSHGDTHLIDFGMPAVDTPAEHQARGMTWLNKAIISGGRLHGKQLPEGSWIYRDSNEENWLVTTDLHGSSDALPSRQVKLTRFGVLGGEKIEHSYSVPCPDFRADIDAAYASEPVPGYTCRMFSAHPRGEGAIFRIGGGNHSQQYPTSSWLQVQLSGPANNCSISISILRSASQTRGLHSETGEPDFGMRSTDKLYPGIEKIYSGVAEPPECESTTAEVDMSPIAAEPGISHPHDDLEDWQYEPAGPGVYEERLDGVIIGLAYKPGGDIAEITASVSRSGTVSVSAERSWSNPKVTYFNELFWVGGTENPVPLCRSSGEEPIYEAGFYSKRTTRSVSVSVEVSISLDGVVQDSDLYEYSYTISTDDRVDTEYSDLWWAYNVTNKSRAWTNTASHNGQEFSRSYEDLSYKIFSHAINPAPQWSESPLSPTNLSVTVPEIEELMDATGRLDAVRGLRGDGGDVGWFSIIIEPVVFANGAYGLRRTFQHSKTHRPTVVTPTGAKTAPEGDYASYNPITGEVARSTDRVNWI